MQPLKDDKSQEQRTRRSWIEAVLFCARFEIVTTTCLSLSSSEPFQRGYLFPFRGSCAFFQIRRYTYSCLLKALLHGCSASFVCVSPARHVWSERKSLQSTSNQAGLQKNLKAVKLTSRVCSVAVGNKEEKCVAFLRSVTLCRNSHLNKK